MAHQPSRRSVLGMLTALGAAVAGGVYFWKTDPESLVSKILDRRFPGMQIDAASILALTRDVKDAKFQTLGRRLALEGGARAAGFVGVDGWFALLSDGQVRRALAVFSIERGGPQMVEPAPQSGAVPGA